ncbi:ATP-binding cassette domain-containing protein [Actinotalea sp. BY-33]|uniref:ATP-binding cassette domain-containing protein n=1 Tax=Actinotalea soli TaxID=2819234 RepID=A0A939LPL1_9CELL|nr:ATP-binding cassette domain-containing protein [Actinotalea soli]MBO1752061.1 ATP-binding cassette domain-containing protein [Actinotalea soli]
MPTTPAPAIEVAGLHKRYGDQTVLDALDLTVPVGTVTALLGPNGAGKTTTVSILSTLIPADGGTARVLGHDVAREPQAVRRLIGVTGQLSAVDPLLTTVENLRLMADLLHLPRLEGRRRVTDLLERFGLTDAARKQGQQLSGGMQRKLDLAMTLVGGPQVVFLDEPTTGLDPRARRDLWDQVRTLVAGGTSVLLTTQYMEEADQLADHVAVLHEGRLVAHDTPTGLKATHDAGSLDDVFLALTDPDRAGSARAGHDSTEVA